MDEVPSGHDPAPVIRKTVVEFEALAGWMNLSTGMRVHFVVEFKGGQATVNFGTDERRLPTPDESKECEAVLTNILERLGASVDIEERRPPRINPRHANNN